MKTLLRLMILSVAFTMAILPESTAQSPSTAATIQRIVASIRQAPPGQRRQLIQAAINNDSSVAASLVDALISAFPSDAPVLTGFVVESVLATTLSTEAKAAVLTAVAQSAVTAALQIPATAVTNLVNTVNDVKLALSNVGADTQLQQAVANFVIPITELPQQPQQQQQPPQQQQDDTLNNDPLPTEIIVSDDNP